jgi:hypothetical protein
MEEKTAQEVTTEFIREFAELNLKIAKHMQEQVDYNTDLLHEIRESAQMLIGYLRL